MRKIEFRAYLWSDSHTNDQWIDYEIGIINFWSNYLHWQGKKSLMQYIGLKDKNGKEMFEGDIVVCRVMHDSNVFGSAWTHQKDEKGMTIANPKVIKHDLQGIDWDWFDDIRYHSEWWEVIGNIYENPEILERAAHG